MKKRISHYPGGDFVANYESIRQIKKRWGKDWRLKFEIGIPRGTPKFSQRRLIKKKLIGLYMRKR